MFTVSFYSYKGGVGRTVSLLNTAWYLAEKGRKILLWDLDLEAPGLQDAYLFNEKQNNKNIWTTPRLKGGFEDIVKIFVKENVTAEEISKCVGKAFTHNLGPGGRISLLGAGANPESPEYRKFLQTFSWKEFYEKIDGRGRIMIEQMFYQFDILGYDYLFIDARTGLTDVADISTIYLPDLVVGLTNLTEQSAKGVAGIFDNIKDANIKIENNEINHEDDGSDFFRQRETIRRNRRKDRRNVPVEFILVGSPLPTGEWEKRNMRIQEIGQRFQHDFDAIINHLPMLAINEENQIVFQSIDPTKPETMQMQSSATADYQKLAEKIVSKNPEAIENILKFSEVLVSLGRWREALPYMITANTREAGNGLRGKNFWESQVGKARASLQSFDTDSAEKTLKELKDTIPTLLDDISASSRTISPQKMQLNNKFDTLSYTQSQAIKIWFEGQMSLAWAYILLNDFQKAFNISKETTTFLDQKTQQCAGNRSVEGELQYLLGFSNWITGQAAQDHGQSEEADAYYIKALRFFQSFGTRSYVEVSVCLAKHASNWLNYDPKTHFMSSDDSQKNINYVEEADKKIIQAQKELPTTNAGELGYINGMISVRQGQINIAKGLLKEAWDNINQALISLKDESDKVLLTEAISDQIRLVTIFGYQHLDSFTSQLQSVYSKEESLDYENNNNNKFWRTIFPIYKKANFLRLDDESQELLRYTLYSVISSYNNTNKDFPKFFKDETGTNLTEFEKYLKTPNSLYLEAFRLLVEGKLEEADTKIKDLKKLLNLTPDSNSDQLLKNLAINIRLEHEIKLLSGIIKYALGKNDDELKQYSEKRGKRGFALESLQAYVVSCLFAAQDNLTQWNPQSLVKRIDKISLNSAVSNGKWMTFLHTVKNSTLFTDRLKENNRFKAFETVWNIVAGENV